MELNKPRCGESRTRSNDPLVQKCVSTISNQEYEGYEPDHHHHKIITVVRRRKHPSYLPCKDDRNCITRV